MSLKKRYIKWLIFWAIAAVSLIILNKLYKILTDTDVALTLGCLSIGISILSLGYTDMSKKKFHGLIHVDLLSKTIQPGGLTESSFSQMNFRIINLSGVSINNFTVTFRLPKKIFYEKSQNDQHLKYFKFGETVIATSDVLKFIGTESGYNDVVFEHYINLNDWKKGNILLTLSGDNIDPTTYVFKHELLPILREKGFNQLLEYKFKL
jgi:hypothetical protein